MGPPSRKLSIPFPDFKGFLWDSYGSSVGGWGSHVFGMSLEIPPFFRRGSYSKAEEAHAKLSKLGYLFPYHPWDWYIYLHLVDFLWKM